MVPQDQDESLESPMAESIGEPQPAGEAQAIVEMERFLVRRGQENAAREWIAYLRQHPEEFRETMVAERMQVETILSDELDGRLFLTWFSVQWPGGTSVQDSERELDRVHLEYWKRCIDRDWGPQTLRPEVAMFSEPVQRAMGA